MIVERRIFLDPALPIVDLEPWIMAAIDGCLHERGTLGIDAPTPAEVLNALIHIYAAIAAGPPSEPEPRRNSH